MFPGKIIAGGLLLVLGRKLFWLYVALLGFAAGTAVAARIFSTRQELLVLVIGLVFGILGALVALFLQNVAIGLAGFLAGAYILSNLADNFGLDGMFWGLIATIVGGIIGAILMAMIFDWALIILTSLAGALMIVEGLQLAHGTGWLLTVVLFAVGLAIQFAIEQPHKRQRSRESASSS